ncbi:malto-oligosyltrehalose synthase, partial [Xanthomonas citri pv. citri]|nr:malto-oligosyltrehalose synthase [Xanthomonas citri pv. citri]
QQTSGMIMAKGVEDTAFYRWTQLTSLTEVGGDPSVFSLTPEQFHTEAARRQRESPATMNALTTHDTKRSASVRARITVLSELP